MDDGYFDKSIKTLILCTENFSLEECQLLQKLLLDYNIVTSLKLRNKYKNTYRIRISRRSMPLLRDLVSSSMHRDFVYKLGV